MSPRRSRSCFSPLLSAGDISDKFGGIWWRHLVAGGLAGAVSRTFTAPMDRLKVLLQVHGGRKQTSIPDTVKYMLKEGGYKGLWRGNGINVIIMTGIMSSIFFIFCSRL